MSKRPLNPEGGRAEKLFFVGLNGSRDRADRIAQLCGMSRSEYLRRRFEQIIAADEARLLTKEDAAQAS